MSVPHGIIQTYSTRWGAVNNTEVVPYAYEIVWRPMGKRTAPRFSVSRNVANPGRIFDVM